MTRRQGAARLGLVLGLLIAAGCGGPKAYVRSGFLEQPPRRVAVLPFVITYAYDLAGGQSIPESHEVGRDLFRKTFYHAFTTFGYEDRKLLDVDAVLAQQWGPVAQEQWRTASPQALGEALGVDALVYGDIQRIMFFATPFYTETSLQATMRMVDAKTGEELWRQRVKVAERGGALLQKGQVVDFVQDQMRSYNPGLKFLRVSDTAVRQAVKGLPNPLLTLTTDTPMARQGGGMRLAILPFGAKRAPWLKPAAALRTFLAADLQEGMFDVIELQRVDAALEPLGWSEGEPLPADLSLDALGKTLGADAILRGTVTEYGRTYAVVESWVKTGLRLELVDPKSGEVVWSDTQRNTRTAGVLKGPTGFKSLATAPITAMKTSNLERVANHLTHQLADALNSSPAVKVYAGEREVPAAP